MAVDPAVLFSEVTKSYERPGGVPFVALRSVSLAVPSGEMVAVVGR